MQKKRSSQHETLSPSEKYLQDYKKYENLKDQKRFNNRIIQEHIKGRRISGDNGNRAVLTPNLKTSRPTHNFNF